MIPNSEFRTPHSPLPAPEFDDTRLWPCVRWLVREFVREVRAALRHSKIHIPKSAIE